MRDKTHTINCIAFKNNGVVISYGQHPVKLQANKGKDYTRSEVRQYDLDIGTKIAFAFLINPQQIRVNKQQEESLLTWCAVFLPTPAYRSFSEGSR